MTDVSYVPGDRTAIVSDCCWVLIDAAPDSAVVTGIWQQLEQGARLDVLVASLLRFGQVPDFVILAAAQGCHHLICRGRASATLVADGPPERVDGTGLTTWLECRIAADVERVVLGDPPGGTGLRLPASAGVFLADSVSVDLTAPSRDRGPGAPSAPAPAAASPAWGTNGSAGGVGAPDTILARAAPVVSGYAAPVSPGRAGLGDTEVGPAEDAGYDFLFGATQARTVEGAAVRPADGEAVPPFPLPAPEALEPLPAPLPAPPVGLPVGREPSGRGPACREPSGRGSAGREPSGRGSVGPGLAGPAGCGGLTGSGGWTDPDGLIDSVPWATDTGYATSAPGVPPGPGELRFIDPRPAHAAAADDDGSTVMRGDLGRHAPWPAAPDRIGPMVQAVLCPDGHPNPPGSPACRRCGGPLPPQAPVTVPRPVLGVLRLSTGDVITLDRGVVMGRSPRTDFDGPDRPHVVKLPSADGEISRTHLQVSLDGWHVLITDLNSTNGTLVELPGREPERLRPAEPLPIQPGTQVILAIGVDFCYEAAE